MLLIILALNIISVILATSDVVAMLIYSFLKTGMIMSNNIVRSFAHERSEFAVIEPLVENGILALRIPPGAVAEWQGLCLRNQDFIFA